MADVDDDGLRGRLQRQGEDALGRLAQELLENPLVTGAISRAFEAREKAAAAQEAAMGALNLPSAADLERLTRRVRSVSQRLEGIEDAVDRVGQRVQGVDTLAKLDARLEAIEAKLDALHSEIDGVKGSLPEQPRKVARTQERMKVEAAES
jgi:predicted  nucleic acid-binding Zn-ribbon protein